MTDEKKTKNTWLKGLGFLLAVIPIGWIYWRLDFHTTLAMLPKVAWWTGPTLFSIVLTTMVLQGGRWWILLHAFIPEIPLSKALAYHFMAMFYGTVLPSGAAPDVIKTLIVAKKNDMPKSWASFWLTRTLGLPALAMLSLYGFLSMDKSTLPRGWEYALALFYLTICAVFLLSFSKRSTRPIRRLLEKFVPKKILTIMERVRESVYSYRNKKKEVALSFLATFLAQTLVIFGSCLTIRGITGQFPLWQCFTFIPLIELISMSFPFTPNGMGPREALSAAMFAYLHLSKEQLGIYIAFLYFFSLLPRLVGVAPIVHRFVKRRRIASSEPLKP